MKRLALHNLLNEDLVGVALSLMSRNFENLLKNLNLKRSEAQIKKLLIWQNPKEPECRTDVIW